MIYMYVMKNLIHLEASDVAAGSTHFGKVTANLVHMINNLPVSRGKQLSISIEGTGN
jgi:hypothetical protein